MLFKDKLSDIIKTLENDGVLLHPTDTVWGLACSSLSETAIDKIYDIKKRERNKPLLMLVDSLSMLKKYVPHIHPRIETLLTFHNKPLTVVYPDVKNLPSFSLADNGSAAIRIVKDDYCNNIVSLLGAPLMSTSANISNDPFPRSYDSITGSIIEDSDFVAEHRRHETLQGKPSVMIAYNKEGELKFLRT